MEKHLPHNDTASILDEKILNLFIEIKRTNSLKNIRVVKSTNIISNHIEFQSNLKKLCYDFLTINNINRNPQLIKIINLLHLLAEKDDLEYTKNLTKEDLKMMGERMGKKFMASENFN